VRSPESQLQKRNLDRPPPELYRLKCQGDINEVSSIA
jgi:hypothetical protein